MPTIRKDIAMEAIYDQAVTEQEVTALLAIPRNAWIRRTMPNLSAMTALARIPETKPGLCNA